MSENVFPEHSKEREVLEALQEYFDGLEALKFRLYSRVTQKPEKVIVQGSPKLKFDAEKVTWQPRRRETGTILDWEIADGQLNKDNEDYLKLKQFLIDAGGSVTSNGKYYWKFDQSDAVGRQDAKTVKHAQK
jgi:regulator of sigma D